MSSNPIIILEDSPSITITPNANTPPQSPPLEPRPRPSYIGITTRASSRNMKSSSTRHRGTSQDFSQEKIDSLRLSDDLNHSATASQRTSGPGEIPPPPQPVIPEEHSPQPNNDMALVGTHLPVKSSASTAKENPQHVSPAPETFPADEKAYPDLSPDALATPKTLIALASSIVLSLSPEVNTEPEDIEQTHPPIACAYSVSTVKPADSTLGPNASGRTNEASQ